jgi:protein TonB
MFEDSLMESTRHLSKRRGWTTLLSSGLQVLVLSVLVILPLLHTDAITASTSMLPTPLISPSPSTGNEPPKGDAISGSPRTPIEVVRNFHPHHFSTEPDREGPPRFDLAQTCTNCGTLPPGFLPGSGTGSAVTFAPEPPKGPTKISHLDPGQIIQRVEPPYPPMARITRTQGPVTLHAVISRDGVIENLQLVSGHPLLVQAALDAVKQWRFRPYLLNGQPIEVETEITINFILER